MKQLWDHDEWKILGVSVGAIMLALLLSYWVAMPGDISKAKFHKGETVLLHQREKLTVLEVYNEAGTIRYKMRDSLLNPLYVNEDELAPAD